MSSTTTVLTADAASAADAALGQQIADLTARVTALEQGSVKPPIPPGPTPSPDGAKATGPGTILVDDALNGWRLAADPALGNVVQWRPAGSAAWVAAGYSANVTAIEKFKATCYQTNGTGWWSWNGTTWATAPGDPSAPVVTPPIVVPPATGANVTIDLTKPGAAVSPYVWGLSTGALADNAWALAANPTAQTSLAKLRPTLVRCNANEDVVRAWATGQTTIMDNWDNNQAKFCAADVRLVMGVGDTSASPSQWASYCTAFAAHRKAIGREILYYECMNEPDGMNVADYNACFIAIADALHGVNPAIKLGGTNASWWGGLDLGQWLAGCASRVGFAAWHAYPVDPGDSQATYYGKALSDSAAVIRQALAGTAAANVEIGCMEWNMDGQPGRQPLQATMDGAIYGALDTISMVNSDPGYTMMAMWDAANDSYYGVIGNQANGGDLSKITPQGWMLGTSGQVMRGARVPFSTALPNVTGLAVKTAAGGSATMLVNSGTAAQSVTLGITGNNMGALRRIELSAAHPNTVSASLTSLSGIALPAQSVVWVATA